MMDGQCDAGIGRLVKQYAEAKKQFAVLENRSYLINAWQALWKPSILDKSDDLPIYEMTSSLDAMKSTLRQRYS